MNMMMGIDQGVLPMSTGEKRAISIVSLLEWAFQNECAQLNFDELNGGGAASVGTEYRLMQQGILGCMVDGGGRSLPHDDADEVVAALSNLSVGRGGKGMALTIADFARSGRAPDWMQDARTRCVPVAWRGNKHGDHAVTERLGSCVYAYRGRKFEREVRHCAITFTPSAAKIAMVRRGYMNWWAALWDLRETLRLYHNLSMFTVSKDMPPRTPWKNSSCV